MDSSTISELVDELAIRIVVDNNIERFAILPNGFQDETPQQLQHDPPIDTAVTGLPFIDLDNYCCGAHGLGLIITTRVGREEHTVMFDCGPESRSIYRNIKALKIPMDKVERIILSHWHADHSNGIPEALKLIQAAQLAASGVASPIPVDLHPSRPIARGSAPAPHFKTVARQPNSPTFDEITALNGIPELHRESHSVAGGAVWVSGEIPRVTEFETGFLSGSEWIVKDGLGRWERDPGVLVIDERYVVIDVKNKGIVVISACSHAGIVNVVQDAVKTFHRPVYMVIGGLHLGGRDMEYRIEPTVGYFANELKPQARFILPLHCTGFKARMALVTALGDACVAGGVGMKIVVSSD